VLLVILIIIADDNSLIDDKNSYNIRNSTLVLCNIIMVYYMHYKLALFRNCSFWV